MPVKLKDIKGCLVDKREHMNCHDAAGYACTCGASDYNKSIYHQGNVSISLNREKLAKSMYESYLIIVSDPNLLPWDKEDNYVKKHWLEIVDAIISQESDILEVRT